MTSKENKKSGKFIFVLFQFDTQITAGSNAVLGGIVLLKIFKLLDLFSWRLLWKILQLKFTVTVFLGGAINSFQSLQDNVCKFILYRDHFNICSMEARA